jgi:predicted MFS family arabinose efflux permease
MQHAVLAARTLVTHSSSSEERAALIGRIGACYGLGFAVGPALGGLLSSVSLPATAWAAAGGSLLALAIVYLGLPAGGVRTNRGRVSVPGVPAGCMVFFAVLDLLPVAQRQLLSADAPPAARSAASKDGSSSESPAADAPRPQQPPPPRLSLASLASITTYRGVPALLLMQAGANLAGAMMHSTFALVLQQRYELSSKQNGLVMSWVGVCVVVGESETPALGEWLAC